MLTIKVCCFQIYDRVNCVMLLFFSQMLPKGLYYAMQSTTSKNNQNACTVLQIKIVLFMYISVSLGSFFQLVIVSFGGASFGYI